MLKLQLFVLSILQILDVLTTQKGFKLGVIELNPFVQTIQHFPGGLWTGKIISTAIVAAILWYVNKEIPDSRSDVINIMMFVIGGLVAVVILNALGLMKIAGIY